MKRTSTMIALALLPVLAVAAQAAARLKMPDFTGLAEKAKESVDISLDGEMLKMAGGFLGGRGGEADLAETVKGLQGIYLRVFSFDKPGMYSTRDIQGLVGQVESQGWKKLMSVREKDKRVEMWMRDSSEEGGMFFVASEPTELVLINIVGRVDLETLRKLQGRMGVPNLSEVPGVRQPPVPPVPAVPAVPAAPAAPPAPPVL